MVDVRSELLDRFRWVGGHADVWRLFYQGDLFARLSAALADPFRGDAITKVAGIEARGFILGSAVALELGAGFVAIRKNDGLFPGEKLSRLTPTDYAASRRGCDSSGSRSLRAIACSWSTTGSRPAARR